jgi:hypothetical protein
MELNAYNNCTDSVVVNMGMKEYCHTYIDPKINFWDVNVRKLFNELFFRLKSVMLSNLTKRSRRVKR